MNSATKDFHLVEDFARKYAHFVQLKVLSPQNPESQFLEKHMNPESIGFRVYGLGFSV